MVLNKRCTYVLVNEATVCRVKIMQLPVYFTRPCARRLMEAAPVHLLNGNWIGRADEKLPIDRAYHSNLVPSQQIHTSVPSVRGPANKMYCKLQQDVHKGKCFIVGWPILAFGSQISIEKCDHFIVRTI